MATFKFLELLGVAGGELRLGWLVPASYRHRSSSLATNRRPAPQRPLPRHRERDRCGARNQLIFLTAYDALDATIDHHHQGFRPLEGVRRRASTATTHRAGSVARLGPVQLRQVFEPTAADPAVARKPGRLRVRRRHRTCCVPLAPRPGAASNSVVHTVEVDVAGQRRWLSSAPECAVVVAASAVESTGSLFTRFPRRSWGGTSWPASNRSPLSGSGARRCRRSPYTSRPPRCSSESRAALHVR